MRLICGLLRLDGAPADPAVVEAMASAMIAPGLSPTVNLRAAGEAALAVLDFSAAGSGAVLSDADGAWLAADLRLDRPAEAASALDQPPGVRLEALALAAARRWDLDLPDRLDGDFALALWDERRKRLLLARDALGVRPLCHATVAGQAFVFASTPAGVIGSGLVALRPDLPALAERLTHAPIETTGLVGVDWLPAACAMAVTPAGPGPARRAWRPDARSVGCFAGDAEEAAERLAALLREAVATRVNDSAPVGVQLSGGLDSSAIAVLAARLSRQAGESLPAYSFLAESSQGSDDERPYIAAVLAQEPNLIGSSFCLGELALDPTGTIDRLTASFIDPVFHEAYAAARADGRVRLLSGLGGDETASQQHYRLHLRILASGRPGTLLRDTVARARRVGVSPARMAYRLLVAPLRFARRPIAPALALLAPDVVARCRVDRDRRLDARPADRLERVTSGLMANRVNDLALIAARHGLAYSFPMLDRRLVEFSLSLPLWLLVRDGYMRQPFRAAMAGVLPEALRNRDSKFLVLPDIGERIEAALPRLIDVAARLREAPAAREFLDFDAVDRVLADPSAGKEPRLGRVVDLARVLATAANLASLKGEQTSSMPARAT